MPQGKSSKKNRLRHLGKKFKSFRASRKNKFPGYPIELKQEVAALYEAGVDVEELVDMAGVCITTVNKWLTEPSTKSVRSLDVVDANARLNNRDSESIQIHLRSGIRMDVPVSSLSAKLLDILKKVS